MIPLLMRHIPLTTHPLFALSRLHQSLLIVQLAEASSSTSSQAEAVYKHLPKADVDAVCAAATGCLSAIFVIFPEGHPVRGVALAELGKLLCVDVEESAVSATQPATSDATGALPSGADRLVLARNTLLRAREELRRGFGKEGGEVGRQVEESIRNLEKEWKGWREVVSQGGLSP